MVGLKMARYDFDLFTIGAGSGGVRASRLSASFGARVAVAEESNLGGTCVNLGCVPKKLFSYASHFRDDFEDAVSYGWDAEVPEFHWDRLRDNKNKEISRLNGIYERILGKAGVQIIEGRARVIDPHTVEVAGKRYTTERILVAVGGRPTVPEGPGAELGISSNEAFHLKTFPKRALVIGGGYISVEFAGIFKGMGAEVTLVHRGDKVLRGFDCDLRTALTEQLGKSGIHMRLNTTAERLEKNGDEIVAHFNDGSSQTFDQVLYATGRRPYTQTLGLVKAGVATDDKGAILVDDHLRTNVEHIYAVGDVTNRINLTPVALAEGMAVAATLFDGRPTKPNYDNIATAVFSQPELATVGLTEEKAREQYPNVRIYRSNFRSLKLTLTDIDERTMMKLVVDADSDRVLGVHVMGDSAAEMVQGFAVALKCGATKAQLDSTIGIHPTSAEELVTMRTPVADS